MTGRTKRLLRISVTTPYCWPEVRRGGERYAHELCAALGRAGHDVTLWSSARKPSNDRVLGVEVRRLRQRPFRLKKYGAQAVEVGFAARVAPRLAARHLDVWHATGIADAAAASVVQRLRPAMRTVFTDHGFPVAASKERRGDAGLYRRVVRDIDSYVCVSKSAGAWLARDYGRTATVVPPGLDLAAYLPGVRDRRPTILFSGQLDEPRKNLDLLLAAAELLIRAVPQLQLWLLGQGTADAALAAATPAVRSAVTRCDAVDDAELRMRYASAWVTVLPSVAESFGMVVVESLAAGTPVVVRADSGGPAQLITDVETGVISGSGTADIANAIRQALDLAARPSTAHACREAAAPYDWDSGVVPRLEEVYAGAG